MTRVLVVDDDAQNRYLLEVLLAGEGMEVESVANGRAALAAARARTPDLVISDILMPEMDGFLLCRAMKADAALRPGTYELDFAAGDYFAALGLDLPTPRFLDVVTLRFGIADAGAHYHVPLLVSPWSYSTYRGS